MIKIAVVVSHPIQHFCPMYSSWSKIDGIDLHVFFASSIGFKPYLDDAFGKKIAWQGLKLDFNHTFLNEGKALPVSLKTDAPDLEEKLNAFRPDVIVNYGYRQKLQKRAFYYAIKKDIPILMISDSELRRHRSLFKRALKKITEPYYLSRVSGFLTVGDANEAYYRNYGVPDYKFFRSPFPIDKNYMENFWVNRNHIKKEMRKFLKIPSDNIVILNVGKIIRRKRQRDILEALAMIDPKETPLSFIVVGSGPEEEALKTKSRSISDHQVIFTGFIQPMDLPKYYILSDIYVQPSEADPHPLAVSEAIYLGTPVVISHRCGSYGPTDDVREGVNGFVYRCGRVDELAHCIERLANDKFLREEFSEASRQIGLHAQELAHGQGLVNALRSLELY